MLNDCLKWKKIASDRIEIVYFEVIIIAKRNVVLRTRSSFKGLVI